MKLSMDQAEAAICAGASPKIIFADIEIAAIELAAARKRIAEAVGALNAELEAARARHHASVRAAALAGADAFDRLASRIQSRPDLFENPRTVVVDGIKLGMQKGKGAIAFDDEDKAMARIRRQLPDQAENLIGCRFFIVKSAVALLSAADLKRIGGQIVGAEDQVLIKPLDTETDRLIAAAIKAALGEQHESS